MSNVPLIEDQFQAPLSNTLKLAYNKLANIISKVPHTERTKKQIDGTGGMVSVNDLIAYQIGWGKRLIAWYKAGIEEKSVDMPGEGFTTWDYVGLARHFYKKYHYDNTHKQDKELHVVVLQIINIIEKEHQTGNLEKLNVWPWCTLPSGKAWPLSKWISVNTIAPYKRATALIRKHLPPPSPFRDYE